ncbi:hypothetical protein DSM104443_01318 [Usitatibacter rugosus]|uniref:Uncharacterized protein n=1 Tax=Usitatibacter rugosus TaxID=2732067 RepID=A0A6M4GUW3_9PROT|nr:hypothetical protein [Usitatibacter rugosus]QJR10264.1 hypothetical protein DSM104443_01318 [Usitatibacter rugosus]
MNPKSVFRKTEKGRDEIAKRTHRLDARRRMVLIVVDGQADAESLAAKVAHLDNALELLESLSAEGFVEPTDGPEFAEPSRPAYPRSTTPRAPAPAPVSPSSLPLEALKRSAVSQVDRLMGPGGEALALRLEAAPTREAFLAEARKVHQALVASVGARKAEDFARSLGL